MAADSKEVPESVNVKLKIALDSLQKVDEYCESKNYGRALAHYFVYLELCPNKKLEEETKFCKILSACGVLLETSNLIDDISKYYMLALQYFPRNVEILNNYGAHLIRANHYTDGYKFLQLATAINPNYLPIERNLVAFKQLSVEPWHFRMLNDHKRNKAYKTAIESIRSKLPVKVLDIGCGSGLLSLFASKNPHVSKIFAVEQSFAISQLANDILHRNDIETVQLISKHSNDLKSSDLPACNLLITEIFDCALLGEHALESIIYSWENLLDKNAIILPCKANIFLTGISCKEILTQHKLVDNNSSLFNLKDICLTQIITQPYEAQDLTKYNFSTITTTEIGIKVDFTNLQLLKDICANYYSLGNVTLKCKTEGFIDAIVIWFDLYLTEDIKITTNPFGENVKCWEQAIIYLDHPIKVTSLDLIEFTISCVNGKLKVTKIDNLVDCNHDCYKVSPEIVAILNDSYLCQQITKLTLEYPASNKVILDLFPFPIFGLLLAKKGATVFIHVENDQNLPFLQYFCDCNEIDFDKINILLPDDLDLYLDNSELFDTIFFNPISINGTINERWNNCLHSFANCLKRTGCILPRKVELCFELVESSYLKKCNEVYDENVFGFKVAEVMNTFSSFEHYMLDDKFDHKKLTAPINSSDILRDNLNQLVEHRFNIPRVQSGVAHAAVYWFRFRFFENSAEQIDTSLCSYYYKAAFILKDCQEMLQQEIVVDVKQYKSVIKISVGK